MDKREKPSHSRDSEDEFDVSNMHVSKRAKIHGVMTTLSPIKISASQSKYFHGELSDGKGKARFVGFDTKLHEKLADFQKKKEAVTLSDCTVNESKYSPDLEIIVKKSTQLLQSPSKFDIPDSMFEVGDNQLVTVQEISKLPNYQRVSVRIKVVAENNPVRVKKGLTKQEYAIADSTACCKITTWEENTGILNVGHCYKLSNLMVRMFNGKKYLSIPKDGFEI